MIKSYRRLLTHYLLLYHIIRLQTPRDHHAISYRYPSCFTARPDQQKKTPVPALYEYQVYSEAVAPTTNASTSLILPRQKGSFILCPALMIVTSHIWT